ncbi:MAG: hypothetical protein RPU39_13710 [Candidatus Sedimenticola sp. (ex Thyasira tokunagai)]
MTFDLPPLAPPFGLPLVSVDGAEGVASPPAPPAAQTRNLLTFGGSGYIETPHLILQAGDSISIDTVFHVTGNTSAYICDSWEGSLTTRTYIIHRGVHQLQYNTNVFSGVTIDGNAIANDGDITAYEDGKSHTLVATVSAACHLGVLGCRYNFIDLFQGVLADLKTTIAGVDTTWNISNGSAVAELPRTVGLTELSEATGTYDKLLSTNLYINDTFQLVAGESYLLSFDVVNNDSYPGIYIEDVSIDNIPNNYSGTIEVAYTALVTGYHTLSIHGSAAVATISQISMKGSPLVFINVAPEHWEEFTEETTGVWATAEKAPDPVSHLQYGAQSGQDLGGGILQLGPSDPAYKARCLWPNSTVFVGARYRMRQNLLSEYGNVSLEIQVPDWKCRKVSTTPGGGVAEAFGTCETATSTIRLTLSGNDTTEYATVEIPTLSVQRVIEAA